MLYYFKSEMYATCQSNCYSLLNDIFVDPQYIRGQKKMFIGLQNSSYGQTKNNENFSK